MQRAAIAIFVAATTAASALPSHVKADAAPEVRAEVTDPGSSNAIAPDLASKSSEAEPRSARLVSMQDICAALETAATAYELPVPFLARLIWQESRFRPDAVSPAGARGIAQFMPDTAEWRGLPDPHDPILSLHASADYLRDLRRQFGNLGLAAAAYNGGSGRVQAWLNGRGGLPTETRQYVRIVTGVPADQWRGKDSASAEQTRRIPAQVPCPALVAMAAAEDTVPVREPAREAAAVVQRAAESGRAGWAVQLAGSFSGSKAKAQSDMLRRKFRSVLNGREPTIVKKRVAGRGKAPMSQVQIAEADRASAERLCAQLRAGGANCVVMRSS